MYLQRSGEALSYFWFKLYLQRFLIPLLLAVAIPLACTQETAPEHPKPPASLSQASPLSGISFTKGPTSAVVTIIEFSDFECPFSGKMAPELAQLLQAYPGKIRLIFKHKPLPFHSHAMLAHEASVAAGAEGKFWEMHDLLFAHQGQLGKDDLLQYAKQLGLNVESFRNALDAHTYRALLDENLEEANGLGVAGTPTFFINGKKMVGAQNALALHAAVDEALGVPSRAGASAVSEADAVQRVEIGSAPIRGPTAAPVTIVEFADFQCPFCARTIPTLQELAHQYPKDVRWVFKNFPLEFHPDSLLAHKAALAAAEQGKFWEMHDLIFINQSAIKRDDLVQKAGQLGLDVKRFLADLDSNKFQPIIEADKAEGTQLGVTGTPTFFINGKRIVGAWPLSEYQRLVEAERHGGGQNRGAATTTTAPVVKPEMKIVRPANPPSAKYSFATKGPETAPVAITLYGDLESPLSAQAAQIVAQLLASYPEKIRLTFKNLPMDFHPHAALAHQAMLAAGAEGKFWQMQQVILASQNKMTRDDLIAHAKILGLDQAKFAAALDSHLYQPVLDEDAAEARSQGVYGVPVFFVNGKRMDGIQPLTTFKQVIDGELAKAQPTREQVTGDK